jgi:myo-inositol catabolism protein IolC
MADGAQAWVPRHEDPLFILTMDHRPSLDSEQATAMRLAKRIIFEGLLAALPMMTSGRAGVLVDEEYGQDVIDGAGHGAAPVVLAVPVEASGQDWFTLEYGEQWLDHVEQVKPDYAKVLIRDNPAFPALERDQQLMSLVQVSIGLQQIGVPLIYELLVPATDEQLNAAGGDPGRYDREIRPGLVATIIADNQAHGINPALWKVEGLETVDAARYVARQVRADGRRADLMVLGRDAPVDQLNHWIEVASQVPEFVGFAIGRSIWEDVIRQYEAADMYDLTAATVARNEIAARYLNFVAQWRLFSR